MGPFSQNSNPRFEQHEDFLDIDDLSDVPDYDSDNTPAKPGDEDNDDDMQYWGTQATNICENSKNGQAHHHSSAQDESNSDLDDLKNIDGLPFQSILPRLISLSQNLTASQLSSSTAPVMTPGKTPINKNVSSLKF